VEKSKKDGNTWKHIAWAGQHLHTPPPCKCWTFKTDKGIVLGCSDGSTPDACQLLFWLATSCCCVINTSILFHLVPFLKNQSSAWHWTHFQCGQMWPIITQTAHESHLLISLLLHIFTHFYTLLRPYSSTIFHIHRPQIGVTSPLHRSAVLPATAVQTPWVLAVLVGRFIHPLVLDGSGAFTSTDCKTLSLSKAKASMCWN
jgi:hypothetical protein